MKHHNGELLTFGYVRRYSNQSIPNSVNNLIRSFYDKYLRWIIAGNQLNRFKTAPIGEEMKSKIITWNDIEFQVVIYPRGRTERYDKNNVTYTLKLVYLPPHIENIQFIFHLFDTNNGLEHRDVLKWTQLTQNMEWWKYIPLIRRDKCRNPLHFNYCIDMKNIIYKKPNALNKRDWVWIKMMHSNIFHEWHVDINDELINKFRTAQIGQIIYSPNFENDNWCLEYVNDGYTKQLYLKLLNIPNKIKSIKVRCKLFGVEVEEKLNYESPNTTGWTMQHLLSQSDIDIDIGLSIKIIKIINIYDDIIDSNQWTEYGIY